MKDVLNVGESLTCGQMLVSKNNMFRAIMQDDGNFVVYDNLDRPIWASNTYGKGGKILTMQADNNLVIYKDDGKAVWSAKSNKKDSTPQLIMQNDQNLVIYNLKDGKACWSINKGKPNEEWKWSTNNWMQKSYELIKDKTLKDICIPGSHDSGMYKRGASTAGAFDCNVLTQSVSIYDQLVYGFRYFDIRPVRKDKAKFYTGHYSKVPVGGWQGADGIDFGTIIKDINNYTKYNKELIILDISHDLNYSNKQGFGNNEWGELLEILTTQLNNLLILPKEKDEISLISKLKFNECINGRSSVIIRVPNIDNDIFNKYKYNGVYRQKSLSVYDQYSNVNNTKDMIIDQMEKLEKFYQTPSGNTCFLLSWTLTQNTKQALSCYLPGVGGASIKELADSANKDYDYVRCCVKNHKPNIFYIDNIKDNILTTFINDYINPKS